MGENVNFLGNEKLLIENGVEVVNLNDQECIDLMAKFIKEKPQDWNEDIENKSCLIILQVFQISVI